MPALALSRHAASRANQRGVPGRLIDALVANADLEHPVGGGCTVLRISRERLEGRDLRRTLGPACDRLRTLALVWSEQTSEVVTVLHDRGGAQGRRYRRAA
jgi:hypothetical protein